MDAKSNTTKAGTLTIGNQNYSFPIYDGTVGPSVINIAKLYDQAGVPVAWRLRDGAGATAHNELPPPVAHYRRSLRRLPPDPRRLIATPLEGIALLEPKRAEAVIDVTRAALTARCREVYAISYANPEEVYLADLGTGTALALIGVLPERRLSLESNYGYLLLSNGVPVGYAGVTPLYRQANTCLLYTSPSPRDS